MRLLLGLDYWSSTYLWGILCLVLIEGSHLFLINPTAGFKYEEMKAGTPINKSTMSILLLYGKSCDCILTLYEKFCTAFVSKVFRCSYASSENLFQIIRGEESTLPILRHLFDSVYVSHTSVYNVHSNSSQSHSRKAKITSYVTEEIFPFEHNNASMQLIQQF